MPNNYLTVDQLKDVAPDGFAGGSTDYDELFLNLAEALSRWVDEETQRLSYPVLDTKFYNGDNEIDFDIDDLVSITSISVSDDDGQTYTALASSDYIAMPHAGDYNGKEAYTVLRMNVNGDYSTWPKGQQSIKVVGVWAHTMNRDIVFQDTGDTVQDNPLSSSATELTFTDIDGADKFGYTPLCSPGQLLQIEDELLEVTAVNITTQKATVIRGVNGSTASAHVQTTQIDKFYPPPTLQTATIIQAMKQFKRGQVGFGDAEALPDLGRILHIKTTDPEAMSLLQSHMRARYS